MLGKRMHHNSKGRLASKGHESGKPSSPGISPYNKPAKIPGAVSVGKTKIDMCPIPYIKIQDNAVSLPRFTAIAARSADEPIGMDELDSLQLELESLLCNTALRVRYFQSEIDSIDTNESKREKKGKAAGKQLQYPVKRKFMEEKFVKTKDYTKLSNQPKVPKFKNYSSASNASHNYANEHNMNSDNSVKLEMPQFALPKNNIPYKFWNSVDPYCAPITLDDIKFLDSLLATSSNTTLPPIPPLGRHYSEVWADEHLAEDQNASNANKQKTGMSPDTSNIRKKIEKSNDNIITGPLTQRLVSALLEENVMSYDVPDVKVKQSGTTKSYKNSLTLEKVLRKELVEQGILDPEDLPPLTNPADDEILAEIKKCQTELTAVRKDNCKNLKNLIGLCKQEMIRLNLKKQLDQVDMECIEVYKKMVAAKQKKRPITKKEKEDAWKVINEQIRLNKEINALPLTGPNSS
ncbi:transcriptional adapter 3 [Amyelois transitella]|uniref:transcriptional adapter 3 n=1 Tax=Amyelois transitella TaxID=680683 RepID=UPI002990112B|nr:transcriptional adapter 3 [Amyelois transitella]